MGCAYRLFCVYRKDNPRKSGHKRQQQLNLLKDFIVLPNRKISPIKFDIHTFIRSAYLPFSCRNGYIKCRNIKDLQAKHPLFYALLHL